MIASFLNRDEKLKFVLRLGCIALLSNVKESRLYISTICLFLKTVQEHFKTICSGTNAPLFIDLFIYLFI